LHLVERARWDLTAGFEAISREFRNVPAGLPAVAVPFFTDGRTLDAWFGAHRTLLRAPERRFTLDSQAEVRAGRNYGSGLGAFASVNGELKFRWLPKARGDDYEVLPSCEAATPWAMPRSTGSFNWAWSATTTSDFADIRALSMAAKAVRH